MLRFSDWPISIHNWVYIFPSCFFGTYSDVLCSEECQTKKLLVCCKMFAFFKAIFKFCTANKFYSRRCFLALLKDIISKIFFASQPTMVGPPTSVNSIPSPPPPPPARAKYRRSVYFMYPPQSYAMKYKLYYRRKSNVTFNLRSRREIDIS